jgi:transposase
LFYDSRAIARPPAANFYARLSEAVGDWQELAAPFASAFCAGFGRPTDPVVFLKIFLVAYLENITYDTDLAERISDSLSIRAFLSYGLEELPPDHSSISRNRAKIGACCAIEEVLERVVVRCQKEGLVSGEGALDSSLIPANASLSSLRSVKTGKGVKEHLREVKERNRETGAQVKVQISNEEFRSTTDWEARIAKKPGAPRDMYYKATHLTDAKAGIILAADCACADKGEVPAAEPVVGQAQRNLAATGKSLGTLLADAGYDDGAFHAKLEEMGATPLTNYQADSCKPEGFRKADFVYDPEADCYRCPAGKLARRVGVSSGTRLYRTRLADCARCSQRTTCIGEGPVRHLKRFAHEDSRERNLARCHTEAGRAALRKRKHIVEPPFGQMKTYGGLGLINCRGLLKARVKVIMAAVAWNLKKLVKALARKAAEAAGPKKDGASLEETGGFRGFLAGFQRLLGSISRLWRFFSSRRPMTYSPLAFTANPE